MTFELVAENALTTLFNLIDSLTASLIPFAESIVEFMSQPIASVLIELLEPLLTLPIIGDILSFFTVDLVIVVFGSMTIPEFVFGYGITFYLVYTIGKWITDLFA